MVCFPYTLNTETLMYEPTEQDEREFAQYVDETERRQIAEAEATPAADRTRLQWALLGWEVGPPVGCDQ